MFTISYNKFLQYLHNKKKVSIDVKESQFQVTQHDPVSSRPPKFPNISPLLTKPLFHNKGRTGKNQQVQQESAQKVKSAYCCTKTKDTCTHSRTFTSIFSQTFALTPNSGHLSGGGHCSEEEPAFLDVLCFLDEGLHARF